MQGRPTGGKILSEPIFLLNPNGSFCAEVKARNSDGRFKLVSGATLVLSNTSANLVQLEELE